jgi:uncharacterized protein
VDDREIIAKKQHLIEIISGYEALVVCFSGGIDSTFLLAVAQQTLESKVMAVTAVSPLIPPEEIALAKQFAATHGIDHHLLESSILEQTAFAANTPERCYHCKKQILEQIAEIAVRKGFDRIAHGANHDDLEDYRPGMRAAQENNVLAPLIEVGLKKQEIRHLARQMGLENWNQPSQPCLATRIPYGDAITLDAIGMVTRAEGVLKDSGLPTCRVRVHGKLARIEVAPDYIDAVAAAPLRRKLTAAFKELGFDFVALDLEGYVAGSMNRQLK